MKNRNNGGFTLVELMVCIVTGSIVMFAAMTVLLFGMRLNNQSTQTAKDQNTARILLAVLEDMATEGTITAVEFNSDSWEVLVEGKVLFSYSANEQTIYSGNGENEGVPFIGGVLSSYVELDLDDKLFTFSVETKDGVYTSSVYCRKVGVAVSGDSGSNKNEDDASSEEDELINDNTIEENVGEVNDSGARIKFLEVLASQYGSEGEIKREKTESSEPQYFSEWYIGSYEKNPGWNEYTPWCACFVSWGLHEILDDSAPKYANVDRFMSYFQDNSRWYDSVSVAEKTGAEADKPIPGDLIFFDWIVNEESNPQHVGAVLCVKNGYVYTIEGNTSGKVAVRKYKIEDPRILGYGVVDWTTYQTS